MGLFNKGENKPSFGAYSEQYFKSQVTGIMWDNESLLAYGFYTDGPDPLGEADVLKDMFGGNSHTFLAATDWRLILGNLTSGKFSSFAYEEIEPQIHRSGAITLFTYTNPILKASNSPTSRSTYNVSIEFADKIEANSGNYKPMQNEHTEILLSRKNWGEGPLAELAKAKSGREFMFIEVCQKCTGTMLAPDDIELSPEKGSQFCGTCLRERLDT